MSGPDREPQAPSFEHLRQLAKRLTRDCRAGDASALERVRKWLPQLGSLDPTTAATRVKLADVQHAIAREHGAESWAALKTLVQSQEPFAAQVARFLGALPEGDLATMRRVLERFPQVANSSIHAACAACDPGAVEARLARGASLVAQRLRDGGWTPLDCVAATPLFQVDEAHHAASLAIGSRLLALGADANTFTLADDDHKSKLSVLYRASERGNAGLVRLLLEHGANPNDGESVYHAAERNHRDVLELLLAHGAEISAAHQPWNNTVLYFLVGYGPEHPTLPAVRSGVQWLLEHGADPNVPSYANRETPLHRIAEFGHGVDLLELMLAHGADPARPRADGRTPYELAMRVGNLGVANRLRALGAAVDPLRPIDAFLSACAAGDEPGAQRLLAAHPELEAELLGAERHAVLRAAESGKGAAVRVIVSLGFDLGVEGPWGGTALHHAAWQGRVELVRALLAAGAPIDVRDRTHGSSPIGWAGHGSAHCREADDDYVAVTDLLIDAGARRDASFNRLGEPPENLASDVVADHLRARGFAPPE